MADENAPIQVPVDDGTIEFFGRLVAHSDSRNHLRPHRRRIDRRTRSLRWTEINIWRVEEQSCWLVEVIGQSKVDGEVPLRMVTSCTAMHFVVDAVRVQSTGVLSNTALSAIAQVEKDLDDNPPPLEVPHG